jgi:DNA-binding XRE family transcriptional regulator
MDLDKEILKSQRDRRAWSQTQLAEVSGLSLRTIQRIEKTGVASQESTKSLAVSMSVLLLNS